MATWLRSTKERAEYEAFVRALLAQPSREELGKHLSDLRCPNPYRVRMKVVYSKAPLSDLLVRKRAKWTVEALGKAGLALKLSGTVGRQPKRKVALPLAWLATDQPNMSVVVSVSTRDQWHAALSFLRSHYPATIPVYLSQRELLQAVLTLRRRSAYDWEFRVRGNSGREPIDSEAPYKMRSVREWTDQELQGTLELISERRRAVTSVTLALHKRLGTTVDVTEAARCRITQQSEVDVNTMFGLIWSTVIREVSGVGQAKLDKFANRGLRERNYQTASLAIQFRTPVLEEIEEVRRLVRTLEHYPSSMHAIDHGNPYANVQITDRYDGSSFDVWAVNATSIILIPGLKATQAAVSRLVHYISNTFREGEVVEFGR